MQTPLEYLEPILREDIQKIWDSVCKPQAYKNTPLSEFFNVEVTALPSYEEKEEQFKDQVAQLRHAQQICKVIKENKDLDLPAHKVMVATVRCEDIANDKLCRLTSDEAWIALEETVQSKLVSGFGRKLSSILDAYFSEYDLEAIYFDEGVRNTKRQQLESKVFDFVHPAHTKLLGHLRVKALDDFKSRVQEMLNKGDGFAASVRTCTGSCMLEFDLGCADAAIKQANWDSSKVREKLRRDIDGLVSSLCSAKLSELVANYEKQLSQALMKPVETLLEAGGKDTWSSIRKLLET
ncbi:hypothetical protein SLA2020_319560 [Shorea laevis]